MELIKSPEKDTSWSDPLSMEYHLSQWKVPKRSTLAFIEFCAKELESSRNVIDLGAGAGAATFQMSQKFLETSFTGIDYDKSLIESANFSSNQVTSPNLKFEVGDWLNLDTRDVGIDGVTSLQTLSWMSEMNAPMVSIFKNLRPRWVALSSLFYDGEISCKVEITENLRQRKTFYNVYSLRDLERLADSFGYELERAEIFEIDVDIPKSDNKDLMGTYTERLESNGNVRRIQVSGPLLMNWYFVLLRIR